MHCKHAIRSRGVCFSHYYCFRARVLRGRTTWAQLEADGLVLPALPPGHSYVRKRMDPLDRAFMNTYGKQPNDTERAQFRDFYERYIMTGIVETAPSTETALV